MSLPGSVGLLSRASLNGSRVNPSSIALPGGGTITGSAGNISLTAAGTNQNIIAAPSGTGYFSVLQNTTEPTYYLNSGIHVTGRDANNTGILLDTFGGSPTYTARRADGTNASPSAVQAGENILLINARGYGATAYSSTGRASYGMLAQENWTDSIQSTRHEFIFTKIGGTATTAARIGGNAILELDSGNAGLTRTAWTTSGPGFRLNSGTYTDTSSSGVVATSAIVSIAQPTIAASSSTTFTDSATFYVANAPANGSNVSQTNPYAVWVAAGATRLDGSLRLGSTLIQKVSALTYASPTSVDVTLGTVFTVTTVNATGSVTFNATAGGTAGQPMTIIITNDATSAKTITFGTNFVANGTLTASGVNKVTTIQFMSNGTNFYEVSRTVLP